MNWFVVAAGVLYLGACVVSIHKREWNMVIVWICYAVANFALTRVR